MSPVFVKAVRDRWVAVAVATVLLGVWLVLAMAVYRDIDLSVYTDLPEGIRQLMGIPDGADAATLAYNVMLEFAAALTLAGLAVSMGASTIAGEERNGTIGLLLANPKSRRHVLAAKTAAMVALIVAAMVAIWCAAAMAPRVLDVDVGAVRLGAMALLLGLNSVFYGLLATAVGAWSGNRSLASALPASIMIASYFAVGLLPLVEPIAGLAEVFPWYYFSGSDPLLDGVRWTHVAVLGTGSAVCAVAATIGLDRRDLRGPSVGVSTIDRLRHFRGTAAVFERLAGSTRVSHIWVKTTSEHQAVVVVAAIAMLTVMGVLMGPMYTAIEGDLATVADDFPETVLALAGGGDLSTPEGWFTVESFSMVAPTAVMVATVVVGVAALAGEEADRTMGLLLANPVRRSRVVVEKAAAMAVYAVAVGTATLVGVAGANLVSGLGMSYPDIVAASALCTLLGLGFGMLALALGAATGHTRLAAYGTIGAALGSHLANSLLPLNDALAGWARLTPHHYYLSSDPLENGLRWGHAGVLAGLSAMLLGAAVWAFEHRDLRSS